MERMDPPIHPSIHAFLPAETSMTDEYHMDQSEAKRYSVDPGDSAFNSISSSYSPKSSYGFRGPSQQFPGGARQSASSPSSFQENNRTGETLHLPHSALHPPGPPPATLQEKQRTGEPLTCPLLGLHLCGAFLTSGHSKRFTTLPNIPTHAHTYGGVNHAGGQASSPGTAR